jgi:hypothetical protein
LRLDAGLSGQGDFYRLNPDGTVTWETVDTQTPLTVSVLGPGGAWVQIWTGIGSVHETALVEPSVGGGYDPTGEAIHFHVQGKLTMVDGSSWSLHVVAMEQDQEFKVLKIDFQPK